jgi:VIT1/CCC1 family predicted Fe2+/Mn2+ transporter
MSESEEKLLDKQIDHLLQEVRVALPGVQVLFAFLLTAPFQQAFDSRLDAADRRVFFATILALAAATLLFIAPTAHHRVRFPEQDKRSALRVWSRLVLAGTVFLALGIAGGVYVVTAALYADGLAAAVAAAVAALAALLWFAAPLMYGGGPASARAGEPGLRKAS